MLYFLVWLVVTIFHAATSIKFKYFIFLTHWGFVVWNSYLILSVIVTTFAMCQSSTFNSKKSSHVYQGLEKDSTTENTRPGCCSKKIIAETSSLPLPFKLQWALFVVGGEYAMAITILYWSFFNDPNSKQNLYSLDSLNLHMINGIFAVVDLWVSGIPVRFYHALYSIAFGCVYVLFTAIYYAVDGTDPDGNQFIYPFLDYGSNPKAAVGLAIGCAVLLVGSIHFIFFIQYLVRHSITNLFCHHSYYYSHESDSNSLK